MAPDEPAHGIELARERYADLYALRAAVQAIPYVGGPLDTLLTGGVAQIQLSRIEDFLTKFDARLHDVEGVSANLSDDAFSDLVLMTFDKVTRTRSEAKRNRFARIVARQVVDGTSWEDAENAVRLLAELEDLHMEVLRVAMTAPESGPPFEGLRVVCLQLSADFEAMQPGLLRLGDALPDSTQPALRMACAELAARGLLHDTGIGRWGTGGMNYFVATDLAVWFSGWISAD
jgi:predicted protein tyrosine phosphatase